MRMRHLPAAFFTTAVVACVSPPTIGSGNVGDLGLAADVPTGADVASDGPAGNDTIGAPADGDDGLAVVFDVGAAEVTADGAAETAAVDAAADVDAACTASGEFGCPCQVAFDCASGLCVDGDDGKVCSKTCMDECPTDWSCVQASSAGDVMFICLPTFANLCKPCASDADCAGNGLAGNHCLPFYKEKDFLDGSFCGTACGPGDSCKAGYACQTLKLAVGGTPVKQCVPLAQTCGCTAAWAKAGFGTTCTKSSGELVCSAKRSCGFAASGQPELSPCSAPVPAAEVCGDNLDNDCNGKTDEAGATGSTAWYPDKDEDGFGTGLGAALCVAPGSGFVSAGGDCNDFNTAVHPGAAEICNNADDNCNGQTDEAGAKACTVYFADVDGDGFGDAANSACMCPSKATSDFIKQSGDCDDAPNGGAKIHPGAVEQCDGKDNDCNGKTDESDAQGCQLFYVDSDMDLYGLAGSGVCLCAASKSHSAGFAGDCDDGAPLLNPGMPEACDGIDNDCNGQTDDGSAASSCPTPAGGKATCSAGVCSVGACAKGMYDVNGDPSDGCECAANGTPSGFGGSCGKAIDLGSLPDGGTAITKSGQILPGEGGDWYTWDAKDMPDTNPAGNCDAFAVNVKFVVNPGGAFVFDVYRGACAASDQLCSAEVVHDWSTSFYGPPPFGPSAKVGSAAAGTTTPSPVPEAAGECKCAPVGLPGMNVCSDNSAKFFLKVFLKPGTALTCDSYVIQFANSGNGTAPPQ